MKYFHRTSVPPDEVIRKATAWFGSRLSPKEESPRRLSFAGSLGSVTIDVQAEGGHYTLVTAATDQVSRSELDKITKRFLGEVHTLADPDHCLRGAY